MAYVAQTAPSLDDKSTTARQEHDSRRKRRAYHRIISGLTVRGRTYRLMTLTTKAGVRDTPAEFQEDWRKLKERLRRRGLLPAYIRVVEWTRSGLPHAHVVIAGGGYIAQWWLSHTWKAVHGAEVVDIRLVAGRGAGRAGFDPGRASRVVAGYLAKYMSKDPAARLAYSPSWLWARLAASWTAWKRAARWGGVQYPEMLAVWRRCCQNHSPPWGDVGVRWALRRNPVAMGLVVLASPPERGHTSSEVVCQHSLSPLPAASTPAGSSVSPGQCGKHAPLFQVETG